MMYRIVSYVKFLLKSTNQHGVHSPFVYQLVTKCFYDRKKRNSYIAIRTLRKQNKKAIALKTAKLLNRIITYLDINSIYAPNNTNTITQKILRADNSITIDNSLSNKNQFDLFFVDWNTTKSSKTCIESIKDKLQNDSLVLIKGIHNSKQNTKNWEDLIQQHPANVSIDTYHLGFIFFRKEQVKEHFTIRV